jgi:hypothetical protein
MSAETMFSIANWTAVAAWLILIFAGRTRWAPRLVCGVIIPGCFAIAYVILAIVFWGQRTGGFGSLAQVAALFTNPWILLAGWIHYLTFDMFAGAWEARDAARHSIPYLLVIPCLILTFLFGPAGFLLYIVIRSIRTKRLAIEDVSEPAAV